MDMENKNKGNNQMKKNFLKLTLKGTKLYIVLILLLSAIYSRLIVYIPMFIEYALDGIILGKEEVIPNYIKIFFYSETNISKILVVSVVLIFVNLSIVLVQYLKNKINIQFNLKINRNVKKIILEHIPKLNYMQFTNIDKSDVVQRVNNDSTTYSEFFKVQINMIFDTIFIVIFAIAQTVKLNSEIAIFISVLCFVIIGISIWYFKTSKPLVEETVQMNKKVIEKATETIEDSKMIKIFNRTQKEIDDFEILSKKYKKKEIKLSKLRVIYVIGTHCIRNFKEPFILLFGGILVVKGEMSLAIISILLTYSTKILGYIYETVEKFSTFNDFRVAYQKLSRLMSYKEDVETKLDVELKGDINFENVEIQINNNTILRNLNFTIKQGENAAIVGDNGSGKTIIAKTLIGFYEYTGEIFIGKSNIKDVSKKSLRDYIGTVLQDTFLFTDTIKNNINILEKNVSNEEIINCCKLADIYEDIKGFEENIDYMIGKGGNNISGGQKQRIAIARTLLMENQFIVFDDSLSKLDTRTKLKILNNIIEMNKGTIIISHDVEVIKKCDKVLFINDKTIKTGTHQKLMEENSIYQQIIEVSGNKILEEEEY